MISLLRWLGRRAIAFVQEAGRMQLFLLDNLVLFFFAALPAF